jgi:hypothetical protein
MYCPRCNIQYPQGMTSCQRCGSGLVNDAYRQMPLPNYVMGPDPSLDYTPIGAWGYFGYNLLFSIPFVGFILILIFALGGTRNVNLRNYSRSFFCIYLVYAIVLILSWSTIIGFFHYYFYI